MSADIVKECPEDSLLGSEFNLALLKEKFGGGVFFDLNLPMPLWKSRDETREVIKKAWERANIIEVTKQNGGCVINNWGLHPFTVVVRSHSQNGDDKQFGAASIKFGVGG